MKSLFRRKQTPQPFLAPLGAAGRLSRLTQRMTERMPSAAVPLAVTVAGGAALLTIVVMWPATDPNVVPAAVAPAPHTQSESAETADTGARQEEPVPVAEESAAETAADLTDAPEEEYLPDLSRTASILPAMPGAGSFFPTIQVAETEDEIAALEEAQRRDVEADVGVPPPPVDQAAALPQDASGMRPAIAKRSVNMRAGPDDGTQVLMVVPGQAEIQAEDGCGWCEITYQGRTGYIYKTFITYAD